MKIFNIMDDFLLACGGEPDIVKVKELFALIDDINFTFSNVDYSVLKKNNEAYYFFTPLFLSTQQRNRECYKIMEFLLKNGANPNFRCNTVDGYLSPLHNLIFNAVESMPFRMQMDWEELEETDNEIKLEITGFKLLIKYGAEINIRSGNEKMFLGGENETPLDWAIRFEHKPAEKYLRSLGAKRGTEISNEEDLLLEKKLSESNKGKNYHFVSWQKLPDVANFTEINDEDIPDF